jgi:hypothetical protein
MKTIYIESNRAILEHEGQTYRRFVGATPGEAHWQERIHTGDFHNIGQHPCIARLEAAYQALTCRVYTLPESTADRRLLLTYVAGEGFEYVIRTSGKYEVFRDEADQQARVKQLTLTLHSCPVNGMLRIGCGDNLCWFI